MADGEVTPALTQDSGALAALAPSLRAQVAGMERADSVTLDLHKWLHVPFEAACVLVRDRKAHREAFALTPEYLERTERGLASGALYPPVSALRQVARAVAIALP